MPILDAVGHALGVAGSMTWQITWSLILGFALSAVIQAVVRRETISRILGDDRPRTLAIATGLGASSSSCSYAAVALARSLFRKGASFTSAMVFEIVGVLVREVADQLVPTVRQRQGDHPTAPEVIPDPERAAHEPDDSPRLPASSTSPFASTVRPPTTALPAMGRITSS